MPTRPPRQRRSLPSRHRQQSLRQRLLPRLPRRLALLRPQKPTAARSKASHQAPINEQGLARRNTRKPLLVVQEAVLQRRRVADVDEQRCPGTAMGSGLSGQSSRVRWRDAATLKLRRQRRAATSGRPASRQRCSGVVNCRVGERLPSHRHIESSCEPAASRSPASPVPFPAAPPPPAAAARPRRHAAARPPAPGAARPSTLSTAAGHRGGHSGR